MKLYSHNYFGSNDLKLFIDKNKIKNNDKLLIQVFTSINNKEFILDLISEILLILPSAKIIGSTTSGEITDDGLSEYSTLLSFCQFEHTSIDTYFIDPLEDSFKTGQSLISKLPSESQNYKVAICFSDGIGTNGEEFLNGISSINKDIVISGGMAGDYSLFEENYIFTQDEIINEGAVIAALNNPKLNIYTDYSFNWEPLGKKHRVQKSIKNRVYKIDDKTAIEFYKYYLGEKVEELLTIIGSDFPLIFRNDNINIGRSIVAKHEDGSISYSGNIQEGTIVQFGLGNVNKILQESENVLKRVKEFKPEGVFIYSCLARKVLLGENVNLEIKPFAQISSISGFFTNGEFYKDIKNNSSTKLLNETMTILAISECEDEKEQDLDISIDKLSRHDRLAVHRTEALSHLISVTTHELEDISTNLQNKVDSEIKKNEQKDKLLTMMQSQAQIGSMMEMIAHQWRQPLNGISSAASGIKMNNEFGLTTYENLNELTEIILDLVVHTNDTIEDFRELFKSEQRFISIKTKDLILKARKILQPLFNRNDILIDEYYLFEDEGKVSLPIGQVVQVLIIILKNSVDVLLENNVTNPKIEIKAYKEDDNCIICIEDNGGGINDEIIERIFEKRFSTKLDTHGTGLGLDICKTVIEKNIKGKVEALNGKNGAIFKISVPLFNKK